MEAQAARRNVTVVGMPRITAWRWPRGAGEAKGDPYCFFIDDENSRTLFLGYAVASERVKAQFDQMGIRVDAERPAVRLPALWRGRRPRQE